MPKYRVMIAQFSSDGRTHHDVADYVTCLAVKMDRDPRIGNGNWAMWRKTDTPITMTRNLCLQAAEQNGHDFVVMIDNDMSPDLPGEGAKPFWESSFDFAIAHDGPCVIAAPYCGPPPFEMPYVFTWQNQQSDNPNPDFQVAAYDRLTASKMTGIQRAAALPTGLMLIDMRAVKRLKHPRFYYEWVDDGPTCNHCGVKQPGPQMQKASTEDVTFSRDLTIAGVPIYCNWDAWAGHWKNKRVGKPQVLGADAISHTIRQRAAELDKEYPMIEKVNVEPYSGVWTTSLDHMVTK